MILKRLYAIFFVLILSVQLFPIVAMSDVFTKGILSEELKESKSSSSFKLLGFEEDTLVTKDLHVYHIPGLLVGAINPISSVINFIKDEALIKCYHLEVLLQPPNF